MFRNLKTFPPILVRSKIRILPIITFTYSEPCRRGARGPVPRAQTLRGHQNVNYPSGWLNIILYSNILTNSP